MFSHGIQYALLASTAARRCARSCSSRHLSDSCACCATPLGAGIPRPPAADDASQCVTRAWPAPWGQAKDATERRSNDGAVRFAFGVVALVFGERVIVAFILRVRRCHD